MTGWIVVNIWANVIRKEIRQENRIGGCFAVLIKYKRVLTANNVNETGKIKILQTSDRVSTVEQGYLCYKR